MRRILMLLAIAATALMMTAGPANAQTPSDVPTFGCIPSNTPFVTGVSGPLQSPNDSVILFQSIPGIFFHVYATATEVDGLMTFSAGVPDGFYQVGFQGRGNLMLLGTVQIGGCTPPPPPNPTSKKQCKDGGWSSFATFKNQGACIAFVNRGSRP
jgi:hypothetical protein